MTHPTALDYLEKTNFEFWDFNECVNTVKKERNCNNSEAYSYLNNLLKSKFNNKSKNWIQNWKSLVKEYEKAEQNKLKFSNNQPSMVFKAHKQTNYIATNQTVNPQVKETENKSESKLRTNLD